MSPLATPTSMCFSRISLRRSTSECWVGSFGAEKSIDLTPMRRANSAITCDVYAGSPSHLNIAGTPNMLCHLLNSVRAVVVAVWSRTGANTVTPVAESTMVRTAERFVASFTSSSRTLKSNCTIFSLRAARTATPMSWTAARLATQ